MKLLIAVLLTLAILAIVQADLISKNGEEILSDTNEGSALSAAKIWRGYATEIKRFFGISGNKGLQMLKTPIPATYDLKDGSQDLSELLDTPSKWGPFRSPLASKDASIAGDYGSFLSILKSKKLSKEDEERLDLFESAMNEKKIVLNEQLERCQGRFDRNNRGKSYPEYERLYCRFIADARISYDVARVTYENELDTVGGLVSRAISSYKEYDGSVYKYKEYQFSTLKSLRSKIDQGNSNPFAIIVQQSSIDSSKKSEDWNYESHIPKEEGFVSEENGDSNSFSFKTASSDFQMKITAENKATIQVSPDNWYNTDVLREHKKGPFLDSSLAKKFFGPTGKLNLLPKTLYMLYKPTVHLTVSSKDAQFFKKRQGATIKVGPFVGKISVKPDKREVDSNNSNLQTVVIEGDATNPVIIAVDNHVF